MRLLIALTLLSTQLIAQPSRVRNNNEVHGYQKLKIYDIYINEDKGQDTFRLITNEYNKHGRIISQLKSEATGVVSLEKFEYEMDTFIVRQQLYQGDSGALIRTTRTQYSDQMQKQEVTNYNADGEEWTKTKFCYDKLGRLKRQKMYYKGRLQFTKRMRYDKEGNLLRRLKGTTVKIEKRQLKENKYVETHYTGTGRFKEIYNEIWKRGDGSIIREIEYLHSEGDAIGFWGSETIIRVENEIRTEIRYDESGKINKEKTFVGGELKYESHYEYIP